MDSPKKGLQVFLDVIERPQPQFSARLEETGKIEPEAQPIRQSSGSQTIFPETSQKSELPLVSRANGDYRPRGSRTLQLYHYSDYTLDYTQIQSTLDTLANGGIKGAEAVLEAIRELVRVGLRNPKGSIENLESYVENLKYGELEEFLYELVPRIAKWALEAEMFFPERNALQILEQDTQRELTLSRFQVLCLMSLSFFGLFPDTTSPDLPEHRVLCFLFYRSKHDNQIKKEKIKFILEYFRQMAKLDEAKLIDPNITYSRRGLNAEKVSQVQFWASQPGDLSEVEFNHTDTVESIEDALQVDFANKFVGGSVLNKGAVQEEIRFLISPETLITMLFTEQFTDTECLWIVGTQILIEHSGYKKELRFIGKRTFSPPSYDLKQRARNVIVCIDALKLGHEEKETQFRPNKLVRELVKSLSGFLSHPNLDYYDVWPVATGKWGCGVFNGDPLLKFLLQWISCSLANRKMFFCTQMDPELKNIERFVEKVKKIPAGYLFTILVKFHTSQTKLSLPMKGLKEFVLQQAEIEEAKRSPLKSELLGPAQ